MTHTFVILKVSQAAYDEIAGLLREAGYGHVFTEVDRTGQEAIDMNNIAVISSEPNLCEECKTRHHPKEPHYAQAAG